MQAHRFVADVIADRLSSEAWRRYLVFEHAFVGIAVLILGHALLVAPGLAQQRRLIASLHGLAETQLPWFAESMELGIAPAGQSTPARVQAFECFMLATAKSGDCAAIVSVMLAAEWMYYTRSTRAAAAPSRNPMLRRWVEMHAEALFAAQVAWLREEADRQGAACDAAKRSQLSVLFGQALALEIGFHTAVYDREQAAAVQ